MSNKQINYLVGELEKVDDFLSIQEYEASYKAKIVYVSPEIKTITNEISI